MIANSIILVAYLSSILLFHRGLAALAMSLSQERRHTGPWRCALIPTVINSLVFIMTHRASVGLMGSWLIILPIFYLELRFLMKVRRWLAASMAVEAVICGLSAALFYWALLAILLQRPLYAFNNLTQATDWWMILPVILCFLSGAGVFQNYADGRKLQSLRYLLTGCHQAYFLIASMVLTLVFLVMQAYLYDNYNQTANDLRTKLWSLISCIYISMGYLFALRYALRVSVLYYMSDRNTAMQQDLDRRAREEEALLETIEVDELTGVLTRHAGERQLRELQSHGIPACLCMVDLDGLKFVNDNLGHNRGDIYLREAAEAIRHRCRHGRDVVCRYGGDEFLVAFVHTEPDDARKRMESVSKALEQRARELDFPMVLSYGAAPWNPQDAWEDVLEKADREMYAMKARHKEQGSHYIR